MILRDCLGGMCSLTAVLYSLNVSGESYVCASNDGFKKIDYLHNINPNWCGNVRASSSMSIKLKKKVKNTKSTTKCVWLVSV